MKDVGHFTPFTPFTLFTAFTVFTLLACRRGHSDARDTAQARPRPTPTQAGDSARARRNGLAVQLFAFADSARAVAVRDSLASAGWDAAIVATGSGAGLRWRVRVAHAASGEYPRFVARALRGAGRDALVVEDSALPPAGGVDLVRVNHGSHGMRATVRWTIAADGSALLVTEDPVSIENDPVPNGFVAATELTDVLVQRDSVWDVVPSPDWRRVAHSRACVASAGGADSLPAAAWRDLAACAGLDAATVRKAAFSTSGMAAAYGVARPIVTALDTTRDAEHPLWRAGGWRVRWTIDGALLALGDPPQRTADDAPPARWTLVDPRAGEDRGVATPSTLVTPKWTTGPSLETGVAMDSTAARMVRVDSAEVTSRGGWIYVARSGAGGGSARRIVGPGVVLTATRSARFVVALAPEPEQAPDGPGWVVVVYRVPQ